jgi:hypothetical protein
MVMRSASSKIFPVSATGADGDVSSTHEPSFCPYTDVDEVNTSRADGATWRNVSRNPSTYNRRYAAASPPHVDGQNNTTSGAN